jgi:hypothetical protein
MCADHLASHEAGLHIWATVKGQCCSLQCICPAPSPCQRGLHKQPTELEENLHESSKLLLGQVNEDKAVTTTLQQRLSSGGDLLVRAACTSRATSTPAIIALDNQEPMTCRVTNSHSLSSSQITWSCAMSVGAIS